MTELVVRVGPYLRGQPTPLHVTDPAGQGALLTSTRQLIGPFLCNTDFWLSSLDMSFLTAADVYTVWQRRDRGGVPYRVSELSTDLSRGVVHRGTISDEVKAAIRALASMGRQIPQDPVPVILEDGGGERYLILDGNRRLTGLLLGSEAESTVMPVCVGHTWLPWWAILARLGMKVAG